MPDSLKEELEFLSKDIKVDLFSHSTILKDAINKKLPVIFKFRLQFLEWYSKGNANFLEILTKQAYPYFEQMKTVKRLYLLATHIIEALDLNKKVVALVQNVGEISPGELPTFDFPQISLEEFLNVICISNPNQDEAKSIIDWTKCSLCIEYITLAAFVINDEKLLVSENKIIELSGTLSEAVQAYISLAYELHLISENEPALKPGKNNSKGAAIFSKALHDKRLIAQHLKNGGELSELKDNFNFATPPSFTTEQ